MSENKENNHNVTKINKVESLVEKVQNQAREEFLKTVKKDLSIAAASVRKCKEALINAQAEFDEMIANKQQELELFDLASK